MSSQAMKLYIQCPSLALQTPTSKANSKKKKINPLPPALTNLHPDLYVKNLKDQIQSLFFIPTHSQRLFKHSMELLNRRTLEECGLSDGDTITLIVQTGGNLNAAIQHSESIEHLNKQLQSHNDSSAVQSATQSPSLIQVLGSLTVSPHLSSLIHQSSLGLSLGLKPKLTEDGTGGTYLLRSAQKQFIGVFKPKDEELFASENPRGYHGNISEMRNETSNDCRGIVPSEGAVREVAAFLIDSKRFHTVPQTIYVSVSRSVFENSNSASGLTSQPNAGLTAALHKPQQDKIGSFQEYIENDDTAGDVSSSLFPVREVHKIAILDMRILNVDRNESNILVKRVIHRKDRNQSIVTTSSSCSGDESSSRVGTPSSENRPFSAHFASSLPIHIAPPKLNIHRGSSVSSEDAEEELLRMPSGSPATGFYMDQAAEPSPAQSPTLFQLNTKPSQFNQHTLEGFRSLLDNCSQSVPNTLSYQSIALSRLSSYDNRPTLQLIPIDHSRSLPDQIELAWDSWCWLEWSQLKEPLDAETKRFVAEIDILADLEMLRSTLGIREECLRVMRIGTLCLKKGVLAGLNLYDIATMMSRSDFEIPSVLEMLCAQAKVWCKVIKNNSRRIQRLNRHSFKETDSEGDSEKECLHERRLNGESKSTLTSPIEIMKRKALSDDSNHSSPDNQLHTQRDCLTQLRILDNRSRRCSLESEISSLFGSFNDSSAAVDRLSQLTATTRLNAQNLAAIDEVARKLALRRSISYDDFHVEISPSGFKSKEISTGTSTPVYKINNVSHHQEGKNSQNQPAELFAALSLSDEEMSELFFVCLSHLLDSHIERVVNAKRAKGEVVEAYPVPRRNNRPHSKSTSESSKSVNPSILPTPTSSPSLPRSRRRLDNISVKTTNSLRSVQSPSTVFTQLDLHSTHHHSHDHDSIFLPSSASSFEFSNTPLSSYTTSPNSLTSLQRIDEHEQHTVSAQLNPLHQRSLQQVNKSQFRSKDDLASLANKKFNKQ